MERKEAIEVVKNHLPNSSFKTLLEALETLIPELKESKDEKIRKEIISIVKSYRESCITEGNHRFEECLAWLEKQGEQKSLDYEDANIMQKDFAPKAGPKFKVGDWIAVNFSEIGLRSPLHIVDSDETVYRVEDANGNSGCPKIEYLTNHYHLWTIEDARDGDVLAIGNEYFIFKNKKGNTSPVVYISHCFCNSAGAFRVTNGRDCGEFLSMENGIKACPATNEQRDFLFQKMKEAGYEWDADKKELKGLEREDDPKDYSSIDPYFGKQIEMRPSWSDEDEEIQHALISTVERLTNCPTKWYFWLKSIKDRIGCGLICTVKDGESNVEKKNTDKVESRFKVGDWVVQRNGSCFSNGSKFAQITNIEGERTIWLNCGTWVTDREIKHWTIYDAKDGDVLAVDSRPFIYNGSKNSVTVGAYCGFNEENIFSCAYNYVINRNIVPATKEQYDHLFQKMREAGYMWDSHDKMLICSTNIESK